MSSDPISKYDSHGFNFCTRRSDTYPFISPLQKPNLQGRYVLVTGAGRGIGRAIAVSFARAGAAGIVIMDLSPSETLADELAKVATEAGHPAPKIISRTADVTSKDDVVAVGEAIRAGFDGRLDAIVLNAGVLEPVLYIPDQDAVKWWRSYEVFVLGVFHCLQVFIPLLRATKDGLGTVLTVNSQASTLLRPGMSGMASAKMGQAKLLDFVNAEYGQAEDGSTPLISYWVHPGAVAHPERKDLPPALSKVQIDKPELPGDCITWLLKERRPWLAGRFISCNWE
ncbi:uncharacterized protein A1O9_05412 [Exophiala aquamarina CBS 119918]|uniref:3-oxoacyl-[acyl-carrier protein] reductase n=1 Tax=Exophiala aquamarina CBS 119918 TaxID=1182545 RepID=A0A072PPP9_9EURO|nr:uncharacterized protein A1O9_05412 [Exophiala aquamarina CBS 119918]KEF57495.1 hypothetical protein A1O9_05412 [Exophiala aquamarina CBS 119918]